MTAPWSEARARASGKPRAARMLYSAIGIEAGIFPKKTIPARLKRDYANRDEVFEQIDRERRTTVRRVDIV